MINRLCILFLAFLLAACVAAPRVANDNAPLVLTPAGFGDLPGWSGDDQDAALAAFRKSCPALLAMPAEAQIGPDPLMGRAADWRAPCQAVAGVAAGGGKAFFETCFTPYAASASGGNGDGLFTGYYEAALRGSRTRHGAYQYPLRLRPGDLVSVNLGDFRPELKGQRIAGRVVAGALKPYPDRAAIRARGLPDDAKLIFVWVDDEADAFFLQVQGSGRIQLDDGSVLRAGYDGQNGWPYTAIGKELIRRGDLTAADMSMQSIRAWLHTHPGEAEAVMDTDRSYVFFKVSAGDQPVGAEGVALTPERSLAVDHTHTGYGVPVFVSAAQAGRPPFRHLMIAQDTGGAIRGPVRGDVFWGYGDAAAKTAGAMKAPGKMWLLLPKTP